MPGCVSVQYTFNDIYISRSRSNTPTHENDSFQISIHAIRHIYSLVYVRIACSTPFDYHLETHFSLGSPQSCRMNAFTRAHSTSSNWENECVLCSTYHYRILIFIGYMLYIYIYNVAMVNLNEKKKWAKKTNIFYFDIKGHILFSIHWATIIIERIWHSYFKKLRFIFFYYYYCYAYTILEKNTIIIFGSCVFLFSFFLAHSSCCDSRAGVLWLPRPEIWWN